MSSPIDLEHFYSERTKIWKPANIRGLFPLEQLPGMISFLAGKPDPATFPFEALTMRLKTLPPVATSTSTKQSNGHVNGAENEVEEITIDGKELEAALQYGATAGLPGLVKWLEEFQTFAHGRKQEDGNWKTMVGSGSQDLLYKAFAALINPGDPVLIETPAYAGILGAFEHYQPDLVEVGTDSDGLDAVHLEKLLANWETEQPGKIRPRLLYTIPMGSNPTGASIPEDRKRDILKIVKKYDLLLLEDDAYAFVYYGDAKKARSYFSLEPEVNGETGRVIRFDSFSKIISSGMRLGFMTAQAGFLQKIELYTGNAHLQTSSTTQAMAYALLKKWGPEGLIAHCDKVSQLYRYKRDVFEEAARKHLTGAATWTTPVAGMFLYIHMDLNKDGSEGDSLALVKDQAVKKGILGVPGTSFMPSGAKTACIRVSFSLPTKEEADEGFRRLREVIDEARASN